MLPEEYQLTTNGDLFLVFDGGIGDPERIFIFASDLGFQFLYGCDHWYADGTFKVYPEVFYQFYTVHGQQRRRNFPCVFGLLPNKTEATYTRFLPNKTEILMIFLLTLRELQSIPSTTSIHKLK